jgi:hypothetical protein
MASNPIINIVGTQCKPLDEEKFNKWYNEVHVPMLMKSKKVLGVSRYKYLGKPGGLPNYIAIYKFASLKDYEDHQASPEHAAAVKEMQETWKGNIEFTSRVQYELVKVWRR